MSRISPEKKNQVIELLRKSNLDCAQIADRLAIPLRSVSAIKANLSRGWYGEKEISAAEQEKYRHAQVVGHKRAQQAKRFTKCVLAKSGYRYLDFDTERDYEYKGIVDLVAVKRDSRDPDLLKIILFQVKGGQKGVSEEELKRLRRAASRIEIQWNYATKPRTTVKFGKELKE